MSRLHERLIDLTATVLLLGFAWSLRNSQPALAGATAYAAIEFWLRKNAQPAPGKDQYQ